jgi:hypothetical protein
MTLARTATLQEHQLHGQQAAPQTNSLITTLLLVLTSIARLTGSNCCHVTRVNVQRLQQRFMDFISMHCA